MAFGKNLIFIFPLILLSCAQVGQISGGDKDEYAPKPVEGKVNPPNETSSFKGNSIEITFDEFIQLNNPQQTMVLVPNHAKLKASITKKTLKIHWDEQLQENTTYVIYLNGTVRDVTENNDSLLSYVFSTGSTLDSLRYSVNVQDAWTNKAFSDATVGLFRENDSLKPYYFTKTNRFGKAEFLYLKAGEYTLKAFNDENNDLQIQANEAIAFRSELIRLDSSIIDTIPLRISKPQKKNKISTFKFTAPGSFIVGANYSLINAQYFLNNEKLDTSLFRKITSDSVQFFVPVKDLSEVELIVKTENFSDTVSLRLTEKEKAAPFQLIAEFKEKQVGPHESISFRTNDLIAEIDESKIHVINPTDSITKIPFKTSIHLNQLIIEIDRANHKQASIIFGKGAIRTIKDQLNDSISMLIALRTEKDYGIIHLDVSKFEDPLIVELLQNNKVIERILLNSDKTYDYEFLFPGEYQFRVIADVNDNGIWDAGNETQNKQAEKVFWFSTPTKLRANWEVDVKLTPTE